MKNLLFLLSLCIVLSSCDEYISSFEVQGIYEPETSSIYCNGGATFKQGITIGDNEATENGSIRYNNEIKKIQYKSDYKWQNILNVDSDLAVPTTSTAPGNIGDIAFDNNYLYVCIQNNVWKRRSLSSW